MAYTYINFRRVNIMKLFTFYGNKQNLIFTMLRVITCIIIDTCHVKLKITLNINKYIQIQIFNDSTVDILK